MQQDRNHASLILALSRSIERHHLGSKIPDLIVDRLVDELLLAPQYQLQNLQKLLSAHEALMAEYAYELYVSGDLSLGYLLSKVHFSISKQCLHTELPSKQSQFTSFMRQDVTTSLLSGGV